MKKMIALLLVLMLLLVGCSEKADVINAEEENEITITPTGYPTGEVQQPQVVYDGLVYYYFATGFDEPLPSGYNCVGIVEVVDNDNPPKYDFHGSRVEVGQEIYISLGVYGTIYVKYEDGYARFSLKQETLDSSEQMQDKILTLKEFEVVCAEGFIDPSKVTVLSGEWAYSTYPNKYVVLATVRYTNKDDEYVTSDFLMLGEFGGEIELRHNLNQHSPYTRENGLKEFGAVDDRRFPLE